jgi:hypothetical protein
MSLGRWPAGKGEPELAYARTNGLSPRIRDGLCHVTTSAAIRPKLIGMVRRLFPFGEHKR